MANSGSRHVIPDRFPVGMYFDPYMGDGTGALRVEPSEMKLVDDVDEGMAHGLAWSFVMPELAAERERSRRLVKVLQNEASVFRRYRNSEFSGGYAAERIEAALAEYEGGKTDDE